MSETKNPNIVTNRHDFLLLFEVTNGNPNGDPDAGNMPRLDPNTSRGLVSDVCLKRKVRNYVHESCKEPDGTPKAGFNLFIQNAHYLNDVLKVEHDKATEEVKKLGKPAKEAVDKTDELAVKRLNEKFYDVRTFGAVMSTGPMKGSSYGQVRGPVQFTFAQSIHPITPLEITLTRCARTDAGEAESERRTGNRTMGHKHIVPYGLYMAKGYVSPAFAKRTEFSNEDLDLLFKALLDMFENDRSAARGEMIVRGLYDFEHVGTQPPENATQNAAEARLGCAHAHVLFEGIDVRLKKNNDGSEKDFPASFVDYEILNHWETDKKMKHKESKNLALPKGVRLHLRHEIPARTI